MKSYSYTELDKLAGEVLPERAVLSTVVPNCSSNVVNPQGGLIGALGLGGHSTATVACSAATVVTGP